MNLRLRAPTRGPGVRPRGPERAAPSGRARVKSAAPARPEPMAAASSTPPAEAGRFRELSTTRKLSFWGFAALVVLGGVFYVWWGLSFGVWIDNGVYAVTITLLLFGLAGMWLVLPSPPAPPNP